MRRMSKRVIGVLLLCLLVGLMCAAMAEDGAYLALPTPTPEPTLPPENEAAESIDKSEGDAPEAAVTLTPEPSVTPTAEPEFTQPPVSEETPEDTAEAETPQSEPTPETSLPPDAPVCKIAGCKHIGVDERGEVVALCALGKSMMEMGDLAQDEDASTELALTDGENCIYRGGAYRVNGGGRNARLYVRGGAAVALAMENADLLTLKLGRGAKVELSFAGLNTVQTLAAGGATLVLEGTGSLTVKNNLNCDALTVRGGNVVLPAGAASRNGCEPVRFQADGVDRVTVNGAFLTDTLPDADGAVTLWLPPLREGHAYNALILGDTLEITQN